MSNRRSKTLGAAALLMLTGPAFAADVPDAAPPIEHSWRFQVSLYGWATAINGDVGIRGLPPANVDISAWDAIQHLDAVPVAGSILATDGTWLFYSDAMWVKVAADANVGPLTGSVRFEQEEVLVTGLVGHSLPVNIPDLELFATAGLRYQHYSVNLSIDPALFPGTSRSGSKGWVDPIIGLAAHYDIDDRWFINAMADIGGFGVSSDFTAQGFAAVGYNWTPTISTALGYRVLYTDYQDGGFSYNVTQHGLFSSVAFRF
ncbi:hypothetical protein [Mesorhizobium sp. AR10]|uniref:hypothetical protein n=1 Tax=Mesorhizobium sp. AR10 TaxID=2865839 RepID=UPI00215EB1C1|nr:hypothetical protein [Mesorhizobium sp. AR10]